MKNFKLFYYSLPSFVFVIIKYLFSRLHNPIIYNFINQEHGKNFGVSKKQRIEILKRIIKAESVDITFDEALDLAKEYNDSLNGQNKIV